MTRICSKATLVLVAVLALAAGASAASPSVSAMNLQAADVPGGKIQVQGAVKVKGYVAVYDRSFKFSTPSGSSRLVGLEVETQLASRASVAATDIAIAEKQFRSSAGLKRFIARVATKGKVKQTAVIVSALRKVAAYDQGFEVPFSFPVKGRRVYQSWSFLRLDRVAVFMEEVGLRPIRAEDTARYASAIAGHIANELTPIVVSLPAVTGTARHGQTLKATHGGWNAPDATFAYQWQRCNASGSNCVDVAGARSRSYTVGRADVGSTLLVVVKATARFGSSSAPSVATSVVR
jgi:hypothetical protein